MRASDDAVVGPVNEAAPASDTASSGLNGRLQRIAQWVTSLIGSTLATKDTPQTSGGYTAARVQSAASTNATSAKVSAGQVYQIALGNNSTIAYLKLYNKASAPTVGTDTPIATYPIPANNSLNIQFSAGKVFSTGIAYAITGGAADSDATAVGANQISGSIEYA